MNTGPQAMRRHEADRARLLAMLQKHVSWVDLRNATYTLKAYGSRALRSESKVSITFGLYLLAYINLPGGVISSCR